MCIRATVKYKKQGHEPKKFVPLFFYVNACGYPTLSSPSGYTRFPCFLARAANWAAPPQTCVT